jgi:hypothetical protein
VLGLARSLLQLGRRGYHWLLLLLLLLVLLVLLLGWLLLLLLLLLRWWLLLLLRLLIVLLPRRRHRIRHRRIARHGIYASASISPGMRSPARPTHKDTACAAAAAGARGTRMGTSPALALVPAQARMATGN